MKRTEKSKFKRAFEITLVAVCVVAVMIFAYADNKQGRVSEIDDTTNVPVIDGSVTIGKKTYTKDRPLKVLEIAPLKFQSELGWLIGSDYYNVKFEDIKELILKNHDRGKELLQNWTARLSAIHGGIYKIQFYYKSVDGTYGWGDFPNDGRIKLDSRLDYRIVDSNGNVFRYKDEKGNVVNSSNIFAYSVFGDYNMADKIAYETKSPSEVTKADIDEADLIYINTAAGMRDGANINFYIQANGYMPDKCPLTQNGVNYTSGKKYSELGEDFSADVAWYLYRTITAEDIAIIFDTNAITQYFVSGSNAVKLAYLLNGVDRDKFKEHFWQHEDVAEKSYSGTMGRFAIENNTFEIYYTYYNKYNNNAPTTNKKIENWNAYMFISQDGQDNFGYSICVGEGNADNGKYYFVAPDYAGHERTTNVWNNVYSYGDWNTLLQQVPAGKMDTDANMAGSSYDDVNHLYGTNGVVPVGSAIKYILGDYSKLYGTLKVLEIEPAGEYKYNELTDAQASQILRYLQISISNLKDDGIASHVDVKSVAMNEFIAMTEDIKSNYDLIIMGDLTNADYKNAFLNFAYSEYGKNVAYDNVYPPTLGAVGRINTVYSGNDLTDKAFEKLKDFMESGRPMVLADSVYTRDKAVIDEKSNVYKLSQLAEGRKNVTDESMKLGGRLKYKERPAVGVDGFDVTYNNVVVSVTDSSGAAKDVSTQIANVNLARERLSDFEFKVSTGDAKRAYNLKIYVDKNGDGLFAGTGENNELVYSGNYGDYSQKLSLPAGLRGYLKWRVVLTDIETGMSADKDGAFVVGYGSNEKRVVKVLQIGPEGNVLSLKDNNAFLSYFAASSDVTGLQLTAEDITVMTTSQYEEWYKEAPYNKDTRAGDKLSKDGEYGFDIIVMGFRDAYNYEDISDENGALSNLINYIQDGNSVLMAHDVLSYSAYSDSSNTNVNISLNPNKNNIEKVAGWSYNITSYLRNIIGMDRYNTATNENKNTGSPYGAGFSNSLNLTNWTRYYSNETGQVNSGQINMYPYEIGENIPVKRTHAQYFQLDLNADDIVVWYALSDDDMANTKHNYRYFNLSGNDALNNYYIYSKGNITYTGAGHSDLKDSDIELQLFVNTIIKAIGSANSIPVVEFDNAIKIDNYSYELAVRDGKLPETITYTVTDKDFFGDTNGTFKEAFVYFDVDGDNRYTEGTDILLVAYDDDEATPIGYLRNMTPETLNFGGDAGIITQWRNSGDTKKIEDANTIEEAFENNRLRIKVQVKDNNNGIGRGTLNIVNKQLFNLN